MDIKYHIETAWEKCIGNVLPLILLTLVVFAVSFATFGILAPTAFAGYTHSLLQLLRYNRAPRVQDVFSQLRLFIPLFLFSLAVLAAGMIGLALLVVPGIIVVIAVSYICLYMLPLMIDQGLGLIEAVKKSAAMVTGIHLTDHVIVFILFFALTAIGGSSFIGFLLLQPFATMFWLSVYEQTVH